MKFLLWQVHVETDIDICTDANLISDNSIVGMLCRKFGKYLEENLRPQWRQHYVDYKALKDLIKDSVSELERDESVRLSFSPRTTSLTVQRPTSRSKNSEEEFYEVLEQEVELPGPTC